MAASGQSIASLALIPAGRQAAGRISWGWTGCCGLWLFLKTGYGIGEVDWSQVEVGVAAAMYGDDELVRMFNSGDVYSAMAQHFFREELPAEDLT